MSSNVFANGREISATKDGTNVLGAMPDVCLSPPSPPAGPIPIPYPNFSQASDTDSGSRSVQIGGDQAALKSSSNYSKCSGDEAATKSFGMSVMSGCIQGKTTSQAYSFDVKIEGADAPRLLDLTSTNNQ